MAGESFMEAPEVPDSQTFDLDAWLSGTMRVVKYVTVYGKAGLQAEIDALDAEALQASDSERAELLARAEALREEMQRSAVGFKMAAISAEQMDRITAKYEDEGDAVSEILAAQCIAPAGMTAEKMAILQERVGDGYFRQTILAAALAAQQGIGVTVPFSSAASLARTRTARA